MRWRPCSVRGRIRVAAGTTSERSRLRRCAARERVPDCSDKRRRLRGSAARWLHIARSAVRDANRLRTLRLRPHRPTLRANGEEEGTAVAGHPYRVRPSATRRPIAPSAAVAPERARDASTAFDVRRVDAQARGQRSFATRVTPFAPTSVAAACTAPTSNFRIAALRKPSDRHAAAAGAGLIRASRMGTLTSAAAAASAMSAYHIH